MLDRRGGQGRGGWFAAGGNRGCDELWLRLEGRHPCFRAAGANLRARSRAWTLEFHLCSWPVRGGRDLLLANGCKMPPPTIWRLAKHCFRGAPRCHCRSTGYPAISAWSAQCETASGQPRGHRPKPTGATRISTPTASSAGRVVTPATSGRTMGRHRT